MQFIKRTKMSVIINHQRFQAQGKLEIIVCFLICTVLIKMVILVTKWPLINVAKGED